jgi:hypothetical protein
MDTSHNALDSDGGEDGLSDEYDEHAEPGEEELSDLEMSVPQLLRNIPDAKLRAKVRRINSLYPERSIETITKVVEKHKGNVRDALTYLEEHEGRPMCLGKRKRSESPPALLLGDEDENIADLDSECSDEETTLINQEPASVNEVEGSGISQAHEHYSIQLTVNVPFGRQEPIVLHLDPKDLSAANGPPVPKKAKLMTPKKAKTLIVKLSMKSAVNTKRRSKRFAKIIKTFKQSLGFMDLAPGKTTTSLHTGVGIDMLTFDRTTQQDLPCHAHLEEPSTHRTGNEPHADRGASACKSSDLLRSSYHLVFGESLLHW